MKVEFHQPAGSKSQGGLEGAVSLLKLGLEAAGVEVVDGSSAAGDESADLVHFHGLWQPGWRKRAARCRRAKQPYVISPHGMLEPWALKHKAWKKWPYYHLFEKSLLSGANCLFATGRMEAEHIAKLLPKSRICCIPLGLSSKRTESYLQSRKRLGYSRGRVLLFLSRIHPKKGLDMLLSALSGIEDPRMKGCRLVVVGGGDAAYLKKLKLFCSANEGRLPDITWKGEIWGEDKWDYMSGADLFCLPSHSENFGMAVLESLQVGTPVLTTNQTPWAEYEGREGCYICAPETVSIREGLLKWLNAGEWTDAQRNELAFDTRSKFDWSYLIPQYLAVYESIVKK